MDTPTQIVDSVRRVLCRSVPLDIWAQALHNAEVSKARHAYEDYFMATMSVDRRTVPMLESEDAHQTQALTSAIYAAVITAAFPKEHS